MHPAFTFVAPPEAGPTHSPPGPLSGWDIPAKDLSDLCGMPTTLGSPLRAYTADGTSPFLASLLAKGATIRAKTVTSELGATVYAEREDVPVLSSPAYPGCTPGGSSTGAAVIVAEGLCRAAHGSDAGGSLRVPAAACEVVGYKPPAPQSARSVDGFLTRTVADQAFLHGVHLNDDVAYRRPRLGVLAEPLFAPGSTASPQRIKIVHEAAEVLGSHCDVRELTPYPGAEETFMHFTHLIARVFATVDPLDSVYIAWLRKLGRGLTPGQMVETQTYIASLNRRLMDLWGVDVVLTPTIADDPPLLGYFPSLSPEDSFMAQTQWSPWCSLFNLTGAPAIAVGPLHLGAITASQETVLGLATVVEKLAVGWRD